MSAPDSRLPGISHRKIRPSFSQSDRSKSRTYTGKQSMSSASPAFFMYSCEWPSFLHLAALTLQKGHTFTKSPMYSFKASLMLSICDDSLILSNPPRGTPAFA